MDKILIIKLNKQDAYKFCEYCLSFKCDIDLINGSTILDAKDFDHVYLMSFDKNYCVSINSNDEQEILRFNRVLDKYIVSTGEQK